MKMDDKTNPNLPMYRGSLREFPEPSSEPRRFFAYLEGTRVVPCTALELAHRPEDAPASSVLRKTTIAGVVITTKFSAVRLDRTQRVLPPVDGEPYWFATWIRSPREEEVPVDYYTTYEAALFGHGKNVRRVMETQGVQHANHEAEASPQGEEGRA